MRVSETNIEFAFKIAIYNRLQVCCIPQNAFVHCYLYFLQTVPNIIKYKY